MIIEKIHARGHRAIRSMHKTTLEITKEDHLTPRGDCIIAVSADKGLLDISNTFKNKLKDENSTLEIVIKSSGIEEKIIARGHPNLILSHPTDMVVRKSNFICSRTLAINSDKSAMDLNRRLVDKLRNSEDVVIELKLIE